MINITFIMPTYNNSKLIERAVNSIVNQMADNDKLIIVDDGSTDGTVQLIQKKYAGIKNLILLEQANAGAGAARNNGIENTHTEYIWFVDSDDYIVDHSIQKVKQYLNNNKSDILFFDYIYKKRIKENRIKINIDPKDKYSLLLSEHYSCNKIFKRDLFNDIRYPNKKMNYEDHATIPKLILKSGKINYLDEALYYYDYSHSDNISKKVELNSDIFLACDYLMDDVLKELNEKGHIEELIVKSLLFSYLLFNVNKTISLKEVKNRITKANNYLSSKNIVIKHSKSAKWDFFKKYYPGKISFLNFTVLKLFEINTIFTPYLLFIVLNTKFLIKKLSKVQ